MDANADRINYWDVLFATFFSALGWGLSWVICGVLLLIAYIDSSVPLQGVINYNLGVGLIGIGATLIGLRIMHVDLPRTHIIILYASWGISSIGLTLLTYGNASSVSNNVFYLPPFEGILFGLVMTWLLVRTVRGLRVEDGMIMGFAWFIAMIFPLIIAQLPNATHSNDGIIWLLSSTPLSPFIGGALGGGITFLFIHRAKQKQMKLPEANLDEPAGLGQLIQSEAQQTTFEVVHDDGKPKAKRKPKPARWSSIPYLRVYAVTLTVAVLLIVGMFAIMNPVREVRVPGFVTPNATNSTPGPQWGNRLPPTNPRWPWNSTVMTNGPVGNIPPNSVVTLGQSFYDFGAEMWWYKAKTSDGYTADAWEWQISLTLVPPPATSVPVTVSSGDLTE